ncbi:hypothetical protein NECAME_13090 [Necator americanus]|uniref:Uncharacterized protein n=1 Tax=Necator americanus TaxID=51031 RepID=W2SX19_NECAM|nr:hypothetical protein NECAME_13090 [Necator americanus]ETN74279.1 hypothetical protein NECAME_13090 [Necator americanus]
MKIRKKAVLEKANKACNLINRECNGDKFLTTPIYRLWQGTQGLVMVRTAAIHACHALAPAMFCVMTAVET